MPQPRGEQLGRQGHLCLGVGWGWGRTGEAWAKGRLPGPHPRVSGQRPESSRSSRLGSHPAPGCCPWSCGGTLRPVPAPRIEPGALRARTQARHGPRSGQAHGAEGKACWRCPQGAAQPVWPPCHGSLGSTLLKGVSVCSGHPPWPRAGLRAFPGRCVYLSGSAARPGAHEGQGHSCVLCVPMWPAPGEAGGALPGKSYWSTQKLLQTRSTGRHAHRARAQGGGLCRLGQGRAGRVPSAVGPACV